MKRVSPGRPGTFPDYDRSPPGPGQTPPIPVGLPARLHLPAPASMTALTNALRRAAHHRVVALGICTVMLTGCALQRHEPLALDPAVSQSAQLSRRADDATWREAMSRLGVDTTIWPLPAWDAPELSALALASHPELAVARTEIAAAQAAGQTARQRANPSIDLSLEHHSAPGQSDSPWTIGIALDSLVGEWLLGQSRRAALTELADARQLEAVERAAQVAWQLHRRVRDSHRALHHAERQSALADEMLALQREESVLWQRRMTLGAAGAPEVLPAQQRQAVARQRAHQARLAVDQARVALAQAIGLPLEQLQRMTIRFDSLGQPQPDQRAITESATASAPVLEPLELQRSALLNNIAVRIALARYAATDAELRLEIARQIPELALKPGYAWDQGDHRWSLGIGYALPLSNRNDGPIAEALARRTAEAARFDALQARAIAELDAARVLAETSKAQLLEARQQWQASRSHADLVTRRIERGDTDRLEDIAARHAELDARRALLDAQSALGNAQAGIEDVVQRPLPPAALTLATTDRTATAQSPSRLSDTPQPPDRTR